MINLKFALVSVDKFVGPVPTGAQMNCAGDFWCFYSWANRFKQSFLCSFDYAIEYPEELDRYDLVMFVACPPYAEKLITLAERTKAVTLWFPDGDTCLYFDNFYGGIQPIYIKAMNACSVVGMAEEDKKSFFETLVDKPVRFIHIPIPMEMINGYFKSGITKNDDILIYGDNNPNNPLTALLVAKRTRKPVATTQVPSHVMDLAKSLGVKVSRASDKQAQDQYLREWVAPSRVMIYPTRWFGTARQPIAGALCGTPVIGSRDSHTQMRLFPDLATSIYDMQKMESLVNLLYTNERFYKDCCDYAFEVAKFYSEENACKRMEEAYEIGRK